MRPSVFIPGLVKPIYLGIILVIALACNEKEPAPKQDAPCMFLGVDTCMQVKEDPLMITINLADEQQTIHSFGGSDCWTTKFFGKWADETKKNRIADLLFSLDTLPDGTPEGIGLSMWRFNIGAGSYEQGSESLIATDWRREECFLNADGTYNWEKQAGQQWFLQAALQRGVEYTLGFSLSPPVYMTRNGKAFNGSGGTELNIQEGKLDEYAGFLADVAQHFQFDYLSPVNEPQWSWGNANGASQEGTQAENGEIAALTTLLSQRLASTKVVIAEAGKWEFLYGSNQDGRGDQIVQFFSPSSANYVGDLPNVAHAISGHSYWTTCPDDKLINVRQTVAAQVDAVDPALQLWQSEFGILGDICGEFSGYPRNTSMDYGLYVAKVLHHDLAIANVSAWSWWLTVSPYNYSDALVYINDPSGMINVDNTKTDGIVLESKQLWCYGNYSRFIRPGMKRIDASIEGIDNVITAANTLMVSAYKDVERKKLVIVLVNLDHNSKVLEIPDIGFLNNTLKMYTTNPEYNLKKSEVNPGHITIAPRAVVTLVGAYQ